MLPSLSDGERRPRDLGRDAVLTAGKLLAVPAVADARASLVLRVFQRDGVADRAAVAASWERMGRHLGSCCCWFVVIMASRLGYGWYGLIRYWNCRSENRGSKRAR